MQYNESPVVIHVNKNPNVTIKCFSWCVGRQGTSTMHNFSLISGCVDYLTLGFAPFNFPFSIFVCLFVCLFVWRRQYVYDIHAVYKTVTYRTSPVCNTLAVPIMYVKIFCCFFFFAGYLKSSLSDRCTNIGFSFVI